MEVTPTMDNRKSNRDKQQPDSVIMALDVGTSSVRGSLFSTSGELLFINQIATPPIFSSGDIVEQDPEVWQLAVLESMKASAAEAAAKRLRVEAIAVSAFRSPVFPVTEEGAPLYNANMWQDRRSAEYLPGVRHAEQAVFQKTGLRISPVFSGLKISWFQNTFPDLCRKAYKFVGVYEYVLYLLTGKFITDHSVASRSNLFNIHSLEWDSELLDLFQVSEDKLAEPVPQAAVCGGLSNAAARSAGLSSGIPIVAAGGDQQCAAVGLGAVKPGTIVANTGTGSYVIGLAEEAVSDPDMGIFCNIGAIPGTYILEASILTSGVVYNWFSKEFYSGSNSYRQMDEEIMSSPPGAHGVVVLPYFAGRGSPDWRPEATGVFYNLTLNTGRCDMARAVVESIAVEMRENIDRIERLTTAVAFVSVSGGMTKFEEFNQIQADIYNRTVCRYSLTEATSLGVWVSSAVAMGLTDSWEAAFRSAVAENQYALIRYAPRQETRTVYDDKLRTHRSISSRLFQGV